MSAKSEAIDRISKALRRISELKGLTCEAPEFMMWRRSTELAISNTFPTKPEYVKEFKDICFASTYIGATEYREVEACAKGLAEAGALLASMLEEIEEYWPDNSPTGPISETQENLEQQVSSNRVFVVHGRDEGTRSIVARFLESLRLEAIILQEQANEGRTIIEKFEDYSDVGFAVVLCTPDDVGSPANDEENSRPRPRQNVVLEWGFFLGKLRRNRVCALVKGDVEIPSDYAGVLYVPLDESGGWKWQLAIELQQAGLPVDLNDLGKTR